VSPKDPDASERYMRDLSTRLSGTGVRNLNLLPTMRAAASAELQNGRTIYFINDAHWNARGAGIAARAAAPWIASC